ncbi:hypothetical protein KKE34_01495 [Patescibacteria group bacterium]|nr:hypothetical protein [Patescibacteria group bacterium]MBU1885263.1 hypothetical protein [Patescibacteria group bacterium]
MLKLTQKQRDQLWGLDGPYSEAKLIIETRILDDTVSRVFNFSSQESCLVNHI